MTRVSGVSNGSQPLHKGKLSRVSDETLQKVAALVSLVCIGLLIAGIVTHVQQTLAFEWNVSMMSVGGAGLLLIGILVKVGVIPDPAKNRAPLPKSSSQPAGHVPSSLASVTAKAPLPPKKQDVFSLPTCALIPSAASVPSETFAGTLRREIDLSDRTIIAPFFYAQKVRIVKGEANLLTIQGPEADVRGFSISSSTQLLPVMNNAGNLDAVLTLKDPSILEGVFAKGQSNVSVLTETLRHEGIVIQLKDQANVSLNSVVKVKKQKIKHEGTGTYWAPSLTSEEAEITIKGKGKVDVLVTKSISGSLSPDADCCVRAPLNIPNQLKGMTDKNFTLIDMNSEYRP